jgi:hypothetical protein
LFLPNGNAGILIFFYGLALPSKFPSVAMWTVSNSLV